MSHHPAYAMSALCFAGGIGGFARTRSLPSLIAGVGLGTLYGAAGYISQENVNGYKLAVGSSVVLAGAMIPRAIKTKKPVPIALALTSLAAGAYYTKKVIDYA
ncbi:transmembrane proteins 14C-domain-containing protein [Absidia repens]|uniref:Transmembrane proteins 14C-domain-containing protein n=1 Tax=Absidia repens TaxID=90262 RepID=A0A1X2IWM6_9FUNG|nr:transmembrane proteins 14C-domain-containing protein [Absidia repens]